MGPFQNRILRKKIETRKLKIPNITSTELKDMNNKVRQKRNIMPRRISSRDSKSNFSGSLLLPTHLV